MIAQGIALGYEVTDHFREPQRGGPNRGVFVFAKRHAGLNVVFLLLAPPRWGFTVLVVLGSWGLPLVPRVA